ncbi:hypothetical protein Tco_0573913 [Tanacetum coccineum]
MTATSLTPWPSQGVLLVDWTWIVIKGQDHKDKRGGAGNEFVHDPNPFPYDNTPDLYDQPPQPQYESYSCELCENDSHHAPIFYDDDDDDDEESSIPLRDIISKLPLSVAIVPDLPIMDSLIMEDEHLNTIPETESDEENESRVKNLIPRRSEDNVKIYSNPLFEFDDEYISSDVNPLFDEVLENIESKDSYVSNLDEPALLVTPLFDFNEDECFDPGGDVDEIEFLLHHDPSTPKISVASILEEFTDEPPLDEIDAFLDMDISTDIENGYHDSKGDIIYLESLLIDDTTPNLLPRIARIMKTLVLVVLSIVHSIFNPSHAYIWEFDILD